MLRPASSGKIKPAAESVSSRGRASAQKVQLCTKAMREIRSPAYGMTACG